MAVAKALGSKRVIAIDIQDERLKFAKSYAATDIWKSTPMNKDENKMDYARRQSEEMAKSLGLDLGQGENSIDLVVDCTGAEICIATGMYLAKDGGTYVQVSLKHHSFVVPPLHFDDVLMAFSNGYRRSEWELNMSKFRKSAIQPTFE